MKFHLMLSLFSSMTFCTVMAQDTIKIQRADNYDKNCFLVICLNDSYFTDSISGKLFSKGNNIELRMNKDCTANKKFDIFVSSFEISAQNNGKNQQLHAQSSFFTDPQKKIIQKIKSNEILTLKNIVIHAPDGFKKIDDLKILIN